jgi:type IV secretory pathway VirB6-like protein
MFQNVSAYKWFQHILPLVMKIILSITLLVALVSAKPQDPISAVAGYALGGLPLQIIGQAEAARQANKDHSYGYYSQMMANRGALENAQQLRANQYQMTADSAYSPLTEAIATKAHMDQQRSQQRAQGRQGQSRQAQRPQTQSRSTQAGGNMPRTRAK